jgi:hypothetical protein
VAACCDVWGNAGGDWVGPLATQEGINGNICLDPVFCASASSALFLRDDSPCAPFSVPHPECDLVGAWPVNCLAAGVPPFGGVGAAGVSLTVAPNPVVGGTAIGWTAPPGTTEAGAILDLYDLSGRLLRSWHPARGPASSFSLTFDGRDGEGRRLAAGAYFFRLRVAGLETQRRLIVIR